VNNVRAIIASFFGVVLMASVIFLAAGKLLFWQAMLYVGLALLGTLLTHLLTPSGSSLAARRAETAKAGEPWDRRLVGIYFLVNLLMFALAGLDAGRFGWSLPFPIAWTVIGAVLMVGGQVLFAFARRENAFFSATVRIDTEGQHRVCSTGPYHFVRHPGYLGMALSVIGFPLVMGSVWSFLPVVVALVLLLVRTTREDGFLMEKLPGYKAYAEETKYKLVPLVF
jgi:protein-S-isoprenylcysteine O-methyltransferase Ste14